MRVPLSWLLEYAAVDPGTEPAEIARRLTAAGLEVESTEQVGHEIAGVIVAEVAEIEELTEFKKPIRYCRVSTGSGEQHVICGAVNFAVGDRVPLAVPGAVLPGGFEIGARKAYGRLSEGMICSAAELAIGDDHSGILVLSPDAPLGADFVTYAGLRDHVFDVNVTPDKGFALSIRGMARELAIAFGAEFTDPADTGLPPDVNQVSADVYPASIEDPTACDRFVLREVRGAAVTRPVPLQMRVRLARAGTRSVSLAVDITNYLMLELGQPMHAFDAGPAARPDRGPPRPAGRAAGDPRPRHPRARPRRHPDHRRLGPDLDGRHHGRPGHRDHRGLTRRGDRGGALRRGGDGADEPQAPAVLGRLGQVRAGRGPGAAAARLGQGRVAAGGAGRRDRGAGLHARTGRRAAGLGHHGRRPPGQGGRNGVWRGDRGAQAAPGRLRDL